MQSHDFNMGFYINELRAEDDLFNKNQICYECRINNCVHMVCKVCALKKIEEFQKTLKQQKVDT